MIIQWISHSGITNTCLTKHTHRYCINHTRQYICLWNNSILVDLTTCMLFLHLQFITGIMYIYVYITGFTKIGI